MSTTMTQFVADALSPAPALPSHFTGKERDTGSGNDYMFARYYNSATGRFLSPDWDAKSDDPVPYAKLDDPQSLNLYSYVENNPIGRADPDGHGFMDVVDFAIGAMNALGSDNFLGAGRVRQTTSAGQAGANTGSLDLRRIDPVQVHVRKDESHDSGDGVTCSPHVTTFVIVLQGTDNQQIYTPLSGGSGSPSFGISLSDEALASRVANALKRAVQLAGGKPSAF